MPVLMLTTIYFIEPLPIALGGMMAVIEMVVDKLDDIHGNLLSCPLSFGPKGPIEWEGGI